MGSEEKSDLSAALRETIIAPILWKMTSRTFLLTQRLPSCCASPESNP